jgi:hypothetical protein
METKPILKKCNNRFEKLQEASEASQPQREAVWATNGKTSGAHIATQCAPDARHRAIGFKVCTDRF